MNSQIINFLKDPASYGAGILRVEVIETHISMLFLNGVHVYKLKKSVKFDFLDFSTLALRRYYCEREVLLNRRYAPELYLGVVAIVTHDSCLRIVNLDTLTPSMTVLEYAVCMKQFASDMLFSQLVQNRKLSFIQCRELASEISRFQSQAKPTPESGSPKQLVENSRANFDAILTYGSVLKHHISLSQLAKQITQEINRHHSLITARQKSHVKLLHGDLHLGNICLYDDKPTLFDGIEFNDQLACCDVWSDLAFLLMDLTHFQRPDLATVLTNAYLEVTDDFAGVPLLNLYLAYRACVRAKVISITQSNRLNDNPQNAEVSTYLEYAAARLVKKPTFVLACGGLSGSGKTTLSTQIAAQTEALHIRTDVVRKHLLQIPLEKKAPHVSYTEQMKQEVYQEVLGRCETALCSGYSVILDSVFGDVVFRQQAKDLATRFALPFHGVWCEVAEPVALERLRHRSGDASDADPEIYHKQKEGINVAAEWLRWSCHQPAELGAAEILLRLGIYCSRIEFPFLPPNPEVSCVSRRRSRSNKYRY